MSGSPLVEITAYHYIDVENISEVLVKSRIPENPDDLQTLVIILREDNTSVTCSFKDYIEADEFFKKLINRINDARKFVTILREDKKFVI